MQALCLALIKAEQRSARLDLFGLAGLAAFANPTPRACTMLALCFGAPVEHQLPPNPVASWDHQEEQLAC